MKYFVIHSGRDYEHVRALITELSEINDNIQFVVLEGNQQNWEGDATARIRECAKILYIVGENSAESPCIQTELDIANRENKDIYVFKLNENYRINDCLAAAGHMKRTRRGDLEGEIVIGKSRERIHFLNEDQLRSRLNADSVEIEMILKGGSFQDKDVLMAQYQLFVQTSEDLVKRKQSVNTFYVTLNSLMLSAIVSVICAVGDILKVVNSQMFVYVVAAFLSVIGVVICGSWITLLNSYSDLNASKMAIISCIEDRLALKLFATEWALLTRRVGNKKYRSFTVKEIAVAKIFLALYILVIAACVVMGVRLL